MKYLNTYEFYDYATFYMDVRRVPDRNGEFFEIYNFFDRVFNCEVNSENISITISTHITFEFCGDECCYVASSVPIGRSTRRRISIQCGGKHSA
jgi:hypothetical protein